ncbi:MAG: hypothetical protein QM758_06625 [Armatimonas sp.]
MEIHLLGGFDVRIEGKPLPPLRSRREQWLAGPAHPEARPRYPARVAGHHPVARQP